MNKDDTSFEAKKSVLDHMVKNQWKSFYFLPSMINNFSFVGEGGICVVHRQKTTFQIDAYKEEKLMLQSENGLEKNKKIGLMMKNSRQMWISP